MTMGLTPLSDSDGRVWLAALERANLAAGAVDLDDLLQHTLNLMLETARAPAGAVYLLESATQNLVCRAVVSLPALSEQAGLPIKAGERIPLAGSRFDRLSRPVWVEPGVLLLPLIPPNAGGLLGLLEIIDPAPETQPLLEFLLRRLVSEIERAAQLERQLSYHRRADALLGVVSQISATLDRDQVLGLMLDCAREVINAEASSLFLLDEEHGDIYLHKSSNQSGRQGVEKARVPAGKGIIGHVIATGEVVLVPDVAYDTRHYHGVDQASGFITRSILAVPLRSRQVVLGSGREAVKERVVGGFEAINKINGTFDQEDAELLTTLARQAATVLEIASLYTDANELFLGIVKALAAAIDAKDPYTEGHSQRVSEYVVEMGRELGLSADDLYHLKIGSLLHDVGKIGVADQIIGKAGKLTDEEFASMRLHPTIGARILSQVRLLHLELPAIVEHHERVDGVGYPYGLAGNQISLFGRIVATADVFDAMTSARPYRQAQSAEEVFVYLQQGIGKQFDQQCVDALMRAYARGAIQTQMQREE